MYKDHRRGTETRLTGAPVKGAVGSRSVQLKGCPRPKRGRGEQNGSWCSMTGAKGIGTGGEMK